MFSEKYFGPLLRLMGRGADKKEDTATDEVSGNLTDPSLMPKEIIEGSCAFQWCNLTLNADQDTRCGKCVFSQSFKSNDLVGPSWRLQLYPDGYTEQLKDYIAIFLESLSNDCDKLEANFSVSLFCDKRELGVRYRKCDIKPGRPEVWFMYLNRSHIFADNLTSRKNLMVACEISYTCLLKANPSADRPVDDGDLSKDWQSLYETSAFSDVTLRLEDREIKAHMLVLSARSPVFSCIFAQQMQKEGFLDINDVSFEVCRQLIRFVYSSKTCDLTVQSAMDLYKAARKFAVFALTERCIRFIRENYEVENAVEVLIFAHEYGESDLKKLMVFFIAKNFKDVSATAIWESTLKDHPTLGNEVLRHIATVYQQL